MVAFRLYLLALTAALVSEPVLAQSRAESPRENVQRRKAEASKASTLIGTGLFSNTKAIAREAIVKLKPLAERGFGFEDAQTALGECYLQLAGMDTDGGSTPGRDKMFAIAEFQSGP